MALGVDQQILDERAEYVNPFQVERGGILSLTTLSGIQYATYEPSPTSDTVPLGLMQHDQEEVDLYRANAPWVSRRAFPEYTAYPYLILGTVITNAIHPDVDAAAVRSGAPAYLGASGMITTDPACRRVGTFDSTLNDPSIRVPGNRAAGSLFRVGGVESIVNPKPVLISTAGWVRIRINI